MSYPRSSVTSEECEKKSPTRGGTRRDIAWCEENFDSPLAALGRRRGGELTLPYIVPLADESEAVQAGSYRAKNCS